MSRDERKSSNVSMAWARLFRAYRKHSLTPDLDTLFHLLEAIHSLNDRLGKVVGQDFIDIDEFVALKSLRNFFHHHGELKDAVRFIPAARLPVSSDLIFMCLIPQSLIDEAINQVALRYRNQARMACERVFHWYGLIININPSIFNFVVRAYERMDAVGVEMESAETDEFRTSYEYDSGTGQAHLIDGRVHATAGDVSKLLLEIMRSS